MKFSRNGKPWLVASKQASRYGFTDPFLITLKDGSRAIAATDGRRAVLLPVDCGPESVKDEHGDSDGIVTKEAMQAAAKAMGKHRDPVLFANGALEAVPGPITFPRPAPAGRFPDVEEVIPRGEPEYRITFNARFLWELAQAMGAESVTLELHGDDLPIAVLPCGIDAEPVPGARGLLMPVGGGS